MLIKHAGKAPRIASGAYIAPSAVICGDVLVEQGCRIMHGAQVIAEGGTIEIGSNCIVFQNAVLRSTGRHSLRVGAHCLIGPNAHLVGCRIEDEVFLATGVAVFHGARVGAGSEVRINGIVHVKSHLRTATVVPIGWVAIGDPAKLFAPSEHEAIWSVQEPLNFPLVAYGYDRADADMTTITRRLSQLLAGHLDDEQVD